MGKPPIGKRCLSELLSPAQSPPLLEVRQRLTLPWRPALWLDHPLHHALVRVPPVRRPHLEAPTDRHPLAAAPAQRLQHVGRKAPA